MYFHIQTDTAGKNGFPRLEAVISLRLSPFSILLQFFFLLSLAQRLHTSGTGALIDLWEQSQIEAETGDGASFCTLSGDPRERKKGVRCIQNKEMGKGAGPSLMEGWEAGSPSPTPRVGHSP